MKVTLSSEVLIGFSCLLVFRKKTDNHNGGHGTEWRLDTVKAYDPATDTWTTKASIPVPNNAFVSAAINGLIYVADSERLDVYNPVTDTWL